MQLELNWVHLIYMAWKHIFNNSKSKELYVEVHLFPHCTNTFCVQKQIKHAHFDAQCKMLYCTSSQSYLYSSLVLLWLNFHNRFSVREKCYITCK